MRGIFGRKQPESGFTVAEVLVAVFIITVGLVGLAGLFPVANQSVSSANHRTTSALLAEQGLELGKNTLLTNWTTLGVGTTTEADIPGFAGYTRTTQVTLVGGDPNFKQVTVTAAFPNQASVQLVTFMANRI